MADGEGGIRKARGRKRPEAIADEIRRWIARESLSPGDRLPPERELMRRFAASKGTMREALKSLESQGLLRIRTGPGGGAMVAKPSAERAIQLLGDYFFSQDLQLADVYALRRLLEPELAASVVGRLDSERLAALEASIGFCACEPLDAETRRRQRLAELDFHDVLAAACPNPALAFFVRYLSTVMKTLAVCRRIYAEPAPDMAQASLDWHRALLDALRREDAGEARRLMAEHMADSERRMLAQETLLERRFLLDDDGDSPPRAA